MYSLLNKRLTAPSLVDYRFQLYSIATVFSCRSKIFRLYCNAPKSNLQKHSKITPYNKITQISILYSKSTQISTALVLAFTGTPTVLYGPSSKSLASCFKLSLPHSMGLAVKVSCFLLCQSQLSLCHNTLKSGNFRFFFTFLMKSLLIFNKKSEFAIKHQNREFYDHFRVDDIVLTSIKRLTKKYLQAHSSSYCQQNSSKHMFGTIYQVMTMIDKYLQRILSQLVLCNLNCFSTLLVIKLFIKK